MVLEKLRNMFKSDKKIFGILYKQNILVGEVETIKIHDNIVTIGKDCIKINQVLNIEIKDNQQEIIITTQYNKYIFISPNYNELYNFLIKTIAVYTKLYNSQKFKYFEYDSVKLEFKEIELVDPQVKIYNHISNYYFSIEEEHTLLQFHKITSNIQNYMDQDNLTFVWSIFEHNTFKTFSMKFTNNIEFLEFVSTFVDCVYKSVNQIGNESAYYKEMFLINNNQEHKKNDNKNMEWLDITPNNNNFNEFNKTKNETNQHLIIDDQNVFVTRGKSLGIFDTNLNFKTQIVNAFDNPKKIITHNGHKNLLGQCEKNRLDLLDLERGEVVEQWKVKDMNDFFNSEKMNNNNTLIGIGDYSIFRIDPRTKEKIVEVKDYKTKNEFSCGTTTEKGNVAIASAKGDLRLYNDINKKAKTLINGFGDPVIGIDTSKDGSLVLCTCKSYILLYQVTNDYGKQILNKDKKTPKRLQLKPQHLSLMTNEINFTTAKFNQQDKLIVSSTNQYLIKWRVQDVLKGNVYEYSITTLDDKVVDENFIVNGDDIIIALPNDVRTITNNNLKKPSF